MQVERDRCILSWNGPITQSPKHRDSPIFVILAASKHALFRIIASRFLVVGSSLYRPCEDLFAV